MSGKFTHYLITRFNVPVKNWDRDKSGRPTLDSAWMEERMQLFQAYCVPTVRQQTERNFIWVVYCDRNTSPADLDIIRKSIGTVQNAEVRLSDDFDELLDDLRQWLAKAQTSFVITSRLDNDDGLGLDYIYKVQSHFAARDKLLINLEGGILYDTGRKVLTRLRHSPFNHYGSLIEQIQPEGSALTVLGYPHDHPPREIEVLNVECNAAWLKIIHDRNLKSRTSGVPVFPKKAIAQFGLSADAFPISVSRVLTYSIAKWFSIVRRKLRFSL